MRCCAAAAVLLLLALSPAAAQAVGELTQKPDKAGCISETGEDGTGSTTCETGRALYQANAVAVSNDGTSVYLNGGKLSGGGLAIFDRTPLGVLAQKPGPAGCFKLNSGGACGEPFPGAGRGGLAVSPDDHHVYASVGGGAFGIFTRAVDGSLTQRPAPGGCVSEDSGAGCQVVKGGGSHRVVVSPDGKNVYDAGPSSHSVGIFDRDATTGQLTQRTTGSGGCVSWQGAGSCRPAHGMEYPWDIAFSPDGSHVYIAASESIAILDRDASGDLTQKAGASGCISADPDGTYRNFATEQCAVGRGLVGDFRSVAVSPDGKSVYTAATGGALAIFDRKADGTLVQKAGADGCVSTDGKSYVRNESGSGVQELGTCRVGINLGMAQDVLVSRDNANVYVANPAGLAIFDRDASTGAVAQKAGPAGCVATSGTSCLNARAVRSGGRTSSGNPMVAISPDGATLYLASYEVGGVSVFDRARPEPDDEQEEEKEQTGKPGPVQTTPRPPGVGVEPPRPPAPGGPPPPAKLPLALNEVYGLKSCSCESGPFGWSRGWGYITISNESGAALGVGGLGGTGKLYVPKPGGRPPSVTTSAVERLKVAPASFTLPPGGKRRLKVTLTKALRRALARRRSVLLQIKGTFIGPAGDRRPFTDTVLVKPKKKKRKRRKA